MTTFQDQIAECIRRAENARDMLVLVVGSSQPENSKSLQSMARANGLHYLQLGEPLAHRLTDIPARRRPMALEAIVSEMLEASQSSRVCVDHTEILFEPTLHCDPLRLALQLSRSRLVLFALDGIYSDGQFVHGYADHPEYFTADLRGLPVITLTNQIPELQEIR